MRICKEEKLRGRTVLLVNTGTDKKKFVLERMKELGVKIIALNDERNWADEFVDHWIFADLENFGETIGKVGQFIKDNSGIEIEGVVTFWDKSVLLTSAIADEFGFVGISREVALLAKDKHIFRCFCQENNLPSPKVRAIGNDHDVRKVLEDFNFPVVVKPRSGANSLFVEKIDSTRKFKKKWEFGLEKLAGDMDIIVEEYVRGKEVDIDMLVQDGEVKFWSVADNIMEEPYFLEVGRMTPSLLCSDVQKEMAKEAGFILKKMGIANGCIHFEAKWTKNGMMPIEVNLRLGGDEVYPSTKKAWGVDLIEGALLIALGENFPKIEKREKSVKYLFSRDFLASNSGLLEDIEIDKGVSDETFFEGCEFLKKVGQEVVAPPRGSDYMGWVMVSGKTPRKARRNLKIAVRMFEFRVRETGKAESRSAFFGEAFSVQLQIGSQLREGFY